MFKYMKRLTISQAVVRITKYINKQTNKCWMVLTFVELKQNLLLGSSEIEIVKRIGDTIATKQTHKQQLIKQQQQQQRH